MNIWLAFQTICNQLCKQDVLIIAEGVKQEYLDEMQDMEDQFGIKMTEEQIAQLKLRKKIAALEELNLKQNARIQKLEQDKEKMKENLDLYKSDVEK